MQVPMALQGPQDGREIRDEVSGTDLVERLPNQDECLAYLGTVVRSRVSRRLEGFLRMVEQPGRIFAVIMR